MASKTAGGSEQTSIERQQARNKDAEKQTQDAVAPKRAINRTFARAELAEECPYVLPQLASSCSSRLTNGHPYFLILWTPLGLR